MQLKVNVKHLGKRKNTIEALIYDLEKKPENVGELIEEMVKVCVKDYTARQENQDLLQVFSKEEIDDKASGGKIAFGVNYGTGKPKLNAAIENAKQSFLDGIVVIFIDNKEQVSLEDALKLTAESNVTFVRMTMLSGRLW